MNSVGNIDNPYLRLTLLLKQTASTFLRNQFQEIWLDSGEKEWENSEQDGQKFIHGIGKLLHSKAGKIQKGMLNQGNVNLWDLPLLIDAFFAIHPSVIKKHPVLKNKYLTQDEARVLRNIRNQLAHAATIDIDKNQFEIWWLSGSAILAKYGVAASDLEKIKTGKLQGQGENKLSEDSKNILEARTINKEGTSLYKQGKFAEAEIFYSKAIRIPTLTSEELSVLYNNRSAARLAMGDITSAKDDAKIANTLRPNWVKPYVRLGSIYVKNKKVNKALVYFEIAAFYAPELQSVKDGIATCRHEITKQNRKEHLDPLLMPLSDFDLNKSQLENAREEIPFKDELAKEFYLQGQPHFICAEAHKFLVGAGGYKQDYEIAAALFSKAATKGSAEGLYNLGKLTMDGQGVKRCPSEAVQLLLRAANMEPTTAFPPGSDNVVRTIGVMEAQHTMGILYQDGIVVQMGFFEAKRWYLRALENGSSFSANNLGMMYQHGLLPLDCDKALEYYKVAAYIGCVRAMENAAILLAILGRNEESALFESLAMEGGSQCLEMDSTLREKGVEKLQCFSEIKFRTQLENDILSGKMKRYIEDKHLLSFIPEYKETQAKFGKVLPGDKELVVNHRQDLKQLRVCSKLETVGSPPTALPKLIPTLTGIANLKEVFFKDFDPNVDDKVYNGHVIQLTAIEDPAVGRPSISLLVQDDSGTLGRVFIYNCKQGPITEEDFGFGCVFSIINPYYRLMADKLFGIRVDNPNLIFRLPDLRKTCKLCRCCRREVDVKVQCRKCRRVKYCSSKCLKSDEEEYLHSLICFKKL